MNADKRRCFRALMLRISAEQNTNELSVFICGLLFYENYD